MSGLYVSQQKLTVFERGSVTVTCHCKNAKITQWCRLGSTCVGNQTGSINGTTVNISTGVHDAFSVTMSDMRTENSGWYWCDNGNLQTPVFITVNESTSTTTTTSTTGTTLSTKATSKT